jgi:hypothetical protein
VSEEKAKVRLKELEKQTHGPSGGFAESKNPVDELLGEMGTDGPRSLPVA